jgi:hypothetical protein
MRLLMIPLLVLASCASLAPAEKPTAKRMLPADVMTLAAPAPDGTLPDIAFSSDKYVKNLASKKDGAGCVCFACFEMSALHAKHGQFKGFAAWVAENYDGGGWPERVDSVVRDYCKAKFVVGFDPKTDFLQYEGDDFKFVKEAIARDELPAVTLHRSPRYYKPVYTMVNCLHLDAKWGCTLDSNFKNAEWRRAKAWTTDAKCDGKTFWAFTVKRRADPYSP